MELIFLGSGSAFTVGSDNYHSNMLLKDGRNLLLIDCGSDARFSLYELGFSYKDIHDVYISHLHADHVGGLEWLAFTTKFDPDCKKPNLYICETLVENLWNRVLAGGLSSLQTEIATLSSYFNVHPIKENSTFTWHNHEIRIVQTIHVMSGFALTPSYGLSLTINGLNVFITTDITFTQIQMKMYEKADLIFHDCETNSIKSNVHAHYDELVSLPASIKKKMWLYHYQPGPLPDAVKDGFRGFVKKGQSFNFDDPKIL